MLTHGRICGVVLAIVICVAPVSARGEINQVETLEWLVADSDVVILGKGVEAGGVADAFGLGRWVDVEVEEVLKGDARAGRIRVWTGLGVGMDVEALRARRHLICLGRAESRRVDMPTGSLVLKSRQRLIDLDGDAGIPSYDGSIPTTSEDVLSTIRRAAIVERKSNETASCVGVTVAAQLTSPAFSRHNAGSQVLLIVPGDARWRELVRRHGLDATLGWRLDS